MRDELAKELTDIYPGFAQKLVDLLSRVVINDREIDYINNHADRLEIEIIPSPRCCATRR